MRETFLYIAGIASIVVVLGLALNETDRAACENHWSKGGINHRYSFTHGCEVQLANGRWIRTAALP
jgi:hypothetical protein